MDSFKPGTRTDPEQLDSIRLVSLCANNPHRSDLWTEFLRRFAGKIKTFIRGTLRQYLSTSFPSDSLLVLDVAQEADLFQNTILRLVENDCAALKRFSGRQESDLLAYLAVVARSSVRSHLRRTRASKRLPFQKLAPAENLERVRASDENPRASEQAVQRAILARELRDLGLRTIDCESGKDSARDRLIFELYFAQDLSTAQIAQCRGIGLSKAGVEKALNRVKDRVRTAAAASSTETVRFR